MRLLYVTDTHIGCSDAGYALQPRYRPEERAALFAALKELAREREVDALIHGGDVVDHGTPEEIDEALEVMAGLGVPTYVCLGNHDLMLADSMEYWRTKGAWLLPEGGEAFACEFAGATLVVVSHHWHPEHSFHWPPKEKLRPRLDERQAQRLEEFCAQAEGPVIVVTHAPLNAVPAWQTGEVEPFHPPHPPYFDTFAAVAARHANFRLALCGHNHAHSVHNHETFVSCTTSSMIERPGQVRILTITDDAIEVETVSLAERAGLSTELADERPWAAGNAASRSFRVSCRGPVVLETKE